MRVCGIKDCGKKVTAKGLCHRHYMRQYRKGTTDYTRWYQEVPTYRAMHGRLRRNFGPASERECIDCGVRAHDWSCNTSERVSGEHCGVSVTYSINIEDYVPRCKPCHVAKDSVHV